MLSILIPVYNFNITSLVTDLHRQAINAGILFEIIVIDDGSSALLRDQNKDVGKLPQIRFLELERNIGRSRIRNLLAEMAIYPTLLFMDCDSEVYSDRYISEYMPYCGKKTVVCGGNIYKSEPPEEPEYMLRWLYGINKEQIPFQIRNKNPYRSFMTNNFLIPRDLFLQIQFDESIIQYGHEDTLFGIELKKRGISITHINNPLFHIGLEISSVFIRKTGEAVENLLTLIYEGKIQRRDIADIRLLRAYEFLKRYRLVGLYLFFYSFISNMVMRNLLGANPSIFVFELYKLFMISQMIRKKETSTLSAD